MSLSPRSRGFTLVELMVAMAATVIVAALVVGAVIALQSEQTVRTKISELQENARQGLDLLERDLRHASLGAATGVVWTSSNGNRVSRPSVQVFTALGGPSAAVITDAKADTDAVLVVEGVPGIAQPAVRTVTMQALTSSVGAFSVLSASGFTAGDPVLLGDYTDACWGVVDTATSSGMTQQLTLLGSVNVLPGTPVPQLGSGAPVRRARARLFYVDGADELVRLTLAAPRAPIAASEILKREVLATGVENMQVDCQMWDGGSGLTACSDLSAPAPVLASVDPITEESVTSLGTFGTGGGPRISVANIARLRGLVVNVAVRSRTPLVERTGDPPIPLLGASGASKTLPVIPSGSLAASPQYVRRAYRLAPGVRNTSLESM